MAIEADIRKKLDGFLLDVRFASEACRIGILGASGSGKSMTLKCIAGIETPDTGSIRMSGKVLFDSSARRNVKPQKRRIGYLFQNYALFPSMTVAENIGAGCRGSKADRNRRVGEMISKFRLTGLAQRLPGELSGGQQQRTALARIMASEPEAVLLDEPFSALDIYLKDQLQRELQELLADYPGTVILVSHSRDEIYRFSEELIVVDQGKVLIHGRTRDIFAEPVYREAAKLTGCKNFSKISRTDDHTLQAEDWGITLHFQKSIPKDASCIGFRAHDFIPVWGKRPKNSIRVSIADRAQLPFEYNYYLAPEGGKEDSGLVCWFVQRGMIAEISRKGMPDYLIFPEDKIMFLRG